LTWIITFNYQHEKEQKFRLKQLIEVIRRINAKNIKLNVSIAFVSQMFVIVGTL
jgi:hypothetical protein